MKMNEIGNQDILCEPLEAYRKAVYKSTTLDLFSNLQPEVKVGDIKVVELFAGVGGFRIGLERASKRFVTVWNNQWEPSSKRQDASMCYVADFGIEGHSNRDIATVPIEEIPDCNLLVGGFPCQDYSVANTLSRSGGIEGKKGVLWWQIYRILHDYKHKPEILFLENVDRLLKSPASQRGRDFAIILASLSDLGYAVEWRVINAADYGMPQRRRRTYIVAYQYGTELFGETCDNKPLDWVLHKGTMAQAFPVSQKGPVQEFEIGGSISDVSDGFNTGHGFNKNCSFENAGIMRNRKVTTLAVDPVYDGAYVTLGQILVDEKDVPEDYFISEDQLPKWQYLKGSKKEKRTAANGHEYMYSEGAMSFPDDLDKPSRTIITSEGGSAPSRFKHVVLTPSGRYRRLVPVELERLDMFPDGHTSQASSDSRRAFLMGNALVTGIVEGVGRSLLQRIDKNGRL